MEKKERLSGYSSMSERPADRVIHKPITVPMRWVQNRTSRHSENASSTSPDAQKVLDRIKAQEILERRRKWVAQHASE